MKKQIVLILEVESSDEKNLTDKFIMSDLETELNCACNSYKIKGVYTEQK